MSGTTTLSFDKTALTERIDPAAAKAAARARLDADLGRNASRSFVARTWLTGLGVPLGLAVAAGGYLLIVQMVVHLVTGRGASLLFFLLAWAIMILPFAVRRILKIAPTLRAADERWYRLDRFARANGLTNTLVEKQASRAATCFTTGTGAELSDVLSAPSPRSFEVADLRFHLGDARTRMDFVMTYARFGLSRRLPPFSLLSASRRGGAAWKPPAPQRRIPVEDEFDREVHVYCAPEDDATVRSLLSPQTRAALVDVAGDIDVQVVGDEAFFIARFELPLERAGVWDWVEDLSALLDARLDPRPGVRAADPDPAQKAQYRALLRGAGIARPILVGCLLPLVLGAAITAAAAFWS